MKKKVKRRHEYFLIKEREILSYYKFRGGALEVILNVFFASSWTLFTSIFICYPTVRINDSNFNNLPSPSQSIGLIEFFHK